MTNTIKNITVAGLTALSLGAAVVSTATPANAQGWRHGYHHGWGGRGAAIGLGLAAGALATGAAYDYYHRPTGYGYGYGDGYYGRPGYGVYGY
jgi:threonine/homoserine/homoserine lactone efflux protein